MGSGWVWADAREKLTKMTKKVLCESVYDWCSTQGHSNPSEIINCHRRLIQKRDWLHQQKKQLPGSCSQHVGAVLKQPERMGVLHYSFNETKKKLAEMPWYIASVFTRLQVIRVE